MLGLDMLMVEKMHNLGMLMAKTLESPTDGREEARPLLSRLCWPLGPAIWPKADSDCCRPLLGSSGAFVDCSVSTVSINPLINSLAFSHSRPFQPDSMFTKMKPEKNDVHINYSYHIMHIHVLANILAINANSFKNDSMFIRFYQCDLEAVLKSRVPRVPTAPLALATCTLHAQGHICRPDQSPRAVHACSASGHVLLDHVSITRQPCDSQIIHRCSSERIICC